MTYIKIGNTENRIAYFGILIFFEKFPSLILSFTDIFLHRIFHSKISFSGFITKSRSFING